MKAMRAAAPALLKAAASLAAGGFAGSAASGSAGVGLACGLCAALCYARAFIQGFYVDRYCSLQADLAGRVALVTGCTVGGLGLEAAGMLARLGATLVLTARSEDKAKAAVQRLRAEGCRGPITYVIVDFLSVGSVRAAALEVLGQQQRLDMLVLNAGVGSGESARVWMANHVGPFLFTSLLAPVLTATAAAHGDVRIVAVSSGAHKRAAIDFENPWEPRPAQQGASLAGVAYGQSKLAQVMHMRELQRRLRAQPALGGEARIKCFAVTPGFAMTNIVAGAVPGVLLPLLWVLSRSPRVGAQVIQQACLDKDMKGGAYLSNCCEKASEGASSCSNDPVLWARLYTLSERCVEEAHSRFP